MSRPTLAIVLIANVLICPCSCCLRQGEAAVNAAESCLSRSASLQLDCRSGESTRNVPAAPDEDGHSCICHGAIIDAGKIVRHDTFQRRTSTALAEFVRLPVND